MIRALPLAALLGLAVSVSIQKIRCFDYWWHLRTGRLIAETGAVPHADLYSFTAHGAPWHDVHWLLQLALYGIYSLGGHAAVIGFELVLVVSLVALLAPIGWRRERPAVTALALGLMLLVASDRIMPRPELPTFVCLAAALWLFDRFERRGDAWIYAIVPIQLLWANFHALYALGLALCVLHLAAELLRPWNPWSAGPRQPARVRRLAAVTLLAGLAAFVSPHGLDAVLYPLKQLLMIGLPGQRAGLPQSLELQSPLSRWRVTPPLALALPAALASASLLAMFSNRRRLRTSDVLVWGMFLGLGLAALRNLALFAIVAAPILVRNLNEWLDARTARWPAGAASCVVSALLLGWLAIDVASGRFFPRIGSLREPGIGIVEVLYPIGAAEWIARERPPAPICHHMGDGGYLLWRLHPDYAVMSDGRLEVYGASLLEELWIRSPQQFQELDRRYHFGSVLVKYSQFPSEQALMAALHRDPAWKLTFVDDVAAVFVRRSQAERWKEVDVGDPDLFPPLPEERTPVNAYRWQVRAAFYAAVGQERRAQEIWHRLSLLYPEYVY